MKKNIKIFLILSDSRSGSTFLANSIIEKLGTLVLPETNFITRLLQADNNTFSSKKILINFLYQEKKFYDLKIKKKELLNNLTDLRSIKKIVLEILDIYYKKNNGSNQYVGIKKGSSLYFLDQIMNLFPKTKILNIIRDSRGVYNSKKKSIYSHTNTYFLRNPFLAAKIWNEKIDIILQSKKKYKAGIFMYEEMIQNLDNTLYKISNILNLKIKKNNFLKIRKKYYVSNLYHGQLHNNIRLEPDVANIEKWKNNLSSSEIFCLEFFTKKNLLKFNYKLVNEPKTMINYASIIIFFLKYIFSKFKKIKLI